ncbi:MAG: WbqC family protein [Alphaproteobacteria bacterium]
MSAADKKIAIMQPTFLPWIGYFGLIESVDEFVFLNHVQFDKRSWQQRNRVKTANGPVWLTVPVVTKGLRDQAINETQIQHENKDFPEKLIRTIEQNYSKAPFFPLYADEVFSILRKKHAHLMSLNADLIAYFCEILGIETPIIFSSEMSVEGHKAALLVNICKERDATLYLSPPGSRDYLEASDDFERAGIALEYFNYNHPEWPQAYGDFEPYMSILDLVFNMGDKSMDTIKQGLS